MAEKIEIKKPILDNTLFTAADWLDNWDESFLFGTVVAKHHVGPHPAGEVVFDSATLDLGKGTVTYQGPCTGLSGTGEAPYAEGCNEETSYTYQLILSVGAQIATE